MTTPLSTTDLDELERLEREATPGPWRECGHDRGGCICGQVWSEHGQSSLVLKPDCGDEVPVPDAKHKTANAALVAATRNALPALLAAARRLEQLESAMHYLAHNNNVSGQTAKLSYDGMTAWAAQLGWKGTP